MNSINNFTSTTDEVRPHTIPLGELARILDLAEARSEPLLGRLRTPRRVGDDVVYPVEVLWRAVLSKYLLGIRYDAELVARLRTDPGLRGVCGFVRVNGDGSILTPTRQVFTRFYKHLAVRQDAVDAAARDIVRELSGIINRGRTLNDHPAGEILAIDSAAIATPRGNYRVHMVCDARWGFPVAHCVRQANVTDCSVLPTLVERALGNHPELAPRYLLADAAYDIRLNYEYLDEKGILPIIEPRKGRPRTQPQRTNPNGGLLQRNVYANRSRVERLLVNLRRFRLLSACHYQGVAKVHLHATLSTFSHLAVMLDRTGAGEGRSESPAGKGRVIDIALARAI